MTPQRVNNVLAAAALLVALATWAMGAIHVYTKEGVEATSRITKVEVKQDDAEKRLDRMETKLDYLVEKLKKW